MKLTKLRNLTFERADGQCEAVYEYGYRCLNPADELHHAFPRRPGGNLLDRLANEALKDGTYDEERHLAHLLALCSVCHHEVAHGQTGRAARVGLRVLGEMCHERWSGRSYYVGPDEKFAQMWPQEVAV